MQTNPMREPNAQMEQAVERGMNTAGRTLYLILWWVSRHVKRNPAIALPSLAVLLALGAALYTHVLHPVHLWQWRVVEGVVALVLAVNAAWCAAKEHDRPHVHALSFEEALQRANLWDNPRYARPRLVRVRDLPTGDVEITVSGLPAVIWRDPDVERPFCAAFGVERFRRVEEDRKRGNVRLVLASGTLDDVATPPTKPTPKAARRPEPADPNAIPLGVGHEGTVVWNPDFQPHLLIAGSTGSGKSTLVRHILYGALQRGWRVYLVDPKGGVDYLELEQQLAAPIAMTAQEALPILAALWDEHLQRLAQLKSLGFPSLARAQAHSELTNVPRVLFAVDELAVFSADTKDKQEKEVRVQAQSYIERLTLAARATGISVLLASQYPTADILGSQVRQQVFRICGRLDDEIGSRTVLGVPGAESISPTTPGRFLYVESGELKEFQGYAS